MTGSNSDFELTTLLDFEPPSFRCFKCGGLQHSLAYENQNYRCAVCNVLYEGQPSLYGLIHGTTATPIVSNFGPRYPDGLTIKYGDDPMAHARAIALRARDLASYEGTSLLGPLVRLLLSARSFVHFTSYGFDPFIQGMLTAVSQFVSVYGIVSGAEPKIAEDLQRYGDESLNLDVRVHSFKKDTEDHIHGKVIIVDGLVAIMTSANMTKGAWRKAAGAMETLMVVTKTRQVIDTNNRYFSTHWTKMNHRWGDLISREAALVKGISMVPTSEENEAEGQDQPDA